MTDPVAEAARSAAERLAPSGDPRLAVEVEAALAARDGEQRPGQYDPTAIAGVVIGAGSLIVSVAQLAWSIVSERGKGKNQAAPSPEAVEREVRITMRERDVAVTAETERITEVVVAEVIRRLGPSQ
jgi:hypothetical protein